jgi:hypothetical protein
MLNAFDARDHRITIACKEVKAGEVSRGSIATGKRERRDHVGRLPYLSSQAGATSRRRCVGESTTSITSIPPPRLDLAGRARERPAPNVARTVARAAALRARPAHRLVAVVRAIDRCQLPSPRVEAFLAQQSPDVVLVHPLIGFGASQRATQ